TEFAEQLSEALELAQLDDGPQAYIPMLAEDKSVMDQLAKADSYNVVHKILSAPLFGRLAAVRGKQVDPEKKELAAAIRNRVKDEVKKMKNLWVPAELEHLFSDMMATREPILMLIELAEAFAERYQAAKAEKNLVDFNDLEHFALQILTGKSKDHRPGPVADELAKYYEEILVDEYQDSNEVQEELIKAISRERFGSPNVFMVGDVKQSIYKFRLAKPELFLKKYETYSKEESQYQKIELHKNFRSRASVLESINDVFYAIMTKALGNIQYTEDAALYAGADYPEAERSQDVKTEMYLLNTGDELLAAMDNEQADYTAKEAEARLIAAKIRELTDPEEGMKIWNRKTGQYEPLRRKDIVILLRSLSGWAEEFLSVLSAEGIPAFAESRTGYFTAVEVETILNMLALIDNPMQDIPLVGVLKSPIVGMTNRELAMVMAAFKKNADRGQDVGFYGAMQMYLSMENPEPEIYEKLAAFWEMLTKLRKEAGYLSVHRLIYRIFELTGYYDYVS
ncbi:MAG: UvrD-helicase domain-containing protein, partial [Lachnospiraceae bacterium]|nr:UvrD-helicase domain-containing protein [Lachnospiraceae bacterium]